MSTIKPISDLRNRFKTISRIVHWQDEPVVITKNGESDMVVMSYGHFRSLKTRLRLYEQLVVAESEDVSGGPTYPLDDVIREVKKSLGH